MRHISRMFAVLFFGFAMSLPQLAVAADDWSHANLQSADGTKVRVDFQAHGYHSGSWSASPVWINVGNSSFAGSERVRAVLVQGLWESPERPWEEPVMEYAPTMIVDLAYAGGGRFSASLGQDVALNTIGQVPGQLRQKLAIVVDGKWLVDPITNRSDFMLNLACTVPAIAWMCR